MTPFASAERRYLEERGRLARLVTVGADRNRREFRDAARSAGERAAA